MTIPDGHAEGAGTAGPGAAPDRPTVDRLLADLRLFESEYDGYQPPPTDQILAAARRARAARADVRADARTGHRPTGALAGRSELDQARHELHLAATLILQRPGAVERLGALTNQPYVDPDGALVLACLMHLAGRSQTARFWFKFAAGGGNATAANCLYFAHRADGEFRDADHWRHQAARLREQAPPQTGHTHVGAPPLAARELRRLLAQCHDGQAPRLPSAVERTMASQGITDQDGYPHENPRPATDLVRPLVG
ncbi:MAG TPA: hypothetical protein VGX23_23595 [Actinocrinis sp.]|nr:hypothetical protein [Actinocrinis sp.]